jgi:hypothetical protein
MFQVLVDRWRDSSPFAPTSEEGVDQGVEENLRISF